MIPLPLYPLICSELARLIEICLHLVHEYKLRNVHDWDQNCRATLSLVELTNVLRASLPGNCTMAGRVVLYKAGTWFLSIRAFYDCNELELNKYLMSV